MDDLNDIQERHPCVDILRLLTAFLHLLTALGICAIILVVSILWV